MNPNLEKLTQLGSDAVQSAIAEYSHWFLISSISWLIAGVALTIVAQKTLEGQLPRKSGGLEIGVENRGGVLRDDRGTDAAGECADHPKPSRLRNPPTHHRRN